MDETDRSHPKDGDDKLPASESLWARVSEDDRKYFEGINEAVSQEFEKEYDDRISSLRELLLQQTKSVEDILSRLNDHPEEIDEAKSELAIRSNLVQQTWEELASEYAGRYKNDINDLANVLAEHYVSEDNKLVDYCKSLVGDVPLEHSDIEEIKNDVFYLTDIEETDISDVIKHLTVRFHDRFIDDCVTLLSTLNAHMYVSKINQDPEHEDALEPDIPDTPQEATPEKPRQSTDRLRVIGSHVVDVVKYTVAVTAGIIIASRFIGGK